MILLVENRENCTAVTDIFEGTDTHEATTTVTGRTTMIVLTLTLCTLLVTTTGIVTVPIMIFSFDIIATTTVIVIISDSRQCLKAAATTAQIKAEASRVACTIS